MNSRSAKRIGGEISFRKTNQRRVAIPGELKIRHYGIIYYKGPREDILS